MTAGARRLVATGFHGYPVVVSFHRGDVKVSHSIESIA